MSDFRAMRNNINLRSKPVEKNNKINVTTKKPMLRFLKWTVWQTDWEKKNIILESQMDQHVEVSVRRASDRVRVWTDCSWEWSWLLHHEMGRTMTECRFTPNYQLSVSPALLLSLSSLLKQEPGLWPWPWQGASCTVYTSNWFTPQGIWKCPCEASSVNKIMYTLVLDFCLQLVIREQQWSELIISQTRQRPPKRTQSMWSWRMT